MIKSSEDMLKLDLSHVKQLEITDEVRQHVLVLKWNQIMKGYIAMFAVSSKQRKKGIVSERMIAMGCEEIYLETEVSIIYRIYLEFFISTF